MRTPAGFNLMTQPLLPVNIDTAAKHFGNQLQHTLQTWLQDVDLVEQQMYRLCAEPAHNDVLLKALRYHLAAGGGRTRCKLALTAGYALGLSREDALAIAVGVELLHNASLVQDDLQDFAHSRRGQPTVWSGFGINTALGLTDLLITAAFAGIADVSRVDAIPELIRRLHGAVAQTLHGQAYDVGQYDIDQLDSKLCLEVARAKSGPLFALGLELPLVAAGYQDFVPFARDAARAFGTGYQIIDDIADRDEDRQQGAIANIVLALELEVGEDQARDVAANMARNYLHLATSLANKLPNQCGYLLDELAEQLLGKLKVIIDA